MTVQRVYEYAAEPAVLKNLLDHALLLAVRGLARQQLRAVECDPAISSLPDADTRRVQSLPVADEFGTAQLPPAAPSAWPVRSADGLGAPISRGCPPPRQRGGPPTTPPGAAPSPYHQWAGECAQRSRAETVMRVRRGRSWLTAASRQPGTAGGPGVCARRHAHGPVG
jgi:hypothetical protein